VSDGLLLKNKKGNATMKKYVQAITALLLVSAMGVSGCDQVKELAIQEADKVKKDVITEIAKAVNASENKDKDKKTDAESSQDADKKEDEKK